MNRTVTLPTWTGFKCLGNTLMGFTKAGTLRWEPPVLVNKNRSQANPLLRLVFVWTAELGLPAGNGCLDLKSCFSEAEEDYYGFFLITNTIGRKWHLFLPEFRGFNSLRL